MPNTGYRRWGRYHWVVLGAVVVLLIAAVVWYITARQTNDYASKTITIGNNKVSAQVADTDATRELGLGKRNGLAKDKAMLFVYDRPSTLCFWMKDMRFPIDMVWLDADHSVVQVKANVAPDTYPQTFCAPADTPARYVIETAANQATALGLRPGARADF